MSEYSKELSISFEEAKIVLDSLLQALRPYMMDEQANLLIDRITSMLAHRPELGKTFLQSDIEELVQKVNEFLRFKNSN
jgi:polyhydroxyalkanoate synthesis regulator phasin